MNDIETLRDYLIADEIQRIQTLSLEKLTSELIYIKTKQIECMSKKDLLIKKQQP